MGSEMCIRDRGVLPQASGSAMLSLGATRLLIGVVAELGVPDQAVPDAGRILISVGCGPGEVALPEYGSDEPLTWLETSLTSLYSHRAVAQALKPLCIVEGAQCWQLRVHVQILQADGCPLDAMSLGVRAALHGTQVPRMTAAPPGDDGDRSSNMSATAAMEGGGKGSTQHDLDLDESLDESVPFDASSIPIFVTVATLSEHIVVDCTAAERRAAGCAISLGMSSDGQTCAMRLAGVYGVNLALMADMLQTARLLGLAMLEKASLAIEMAAEHAQVRGFPYTDDGAIGLLA